MSKTYAQGREEIARLTHYFTTNRDSFLEPGMKEAHICQNLIEPLFEALGWDVRNSARSAPQYREVITQDTVDVEGSQKAPDYAFRVGTLTKFFTEAKKCGVNLKGDPAPAYQLRRYGWSAKVPVSLLTDFEELAVYDCTARPKEADKSSHARILYFGCEEYVDRWRELWDVFSHEAVWSGAFDQYAASKRKRGTSEVDVEFLKEIEGWRETLARNIALRNKSISSDDLNAAVQVTIDRIVFLRMAEDRGLEPYEQLLKLCERPEIYARFMRDVCRRADEKYNSGLFHFQKETGIAEAPDRITPALEIDDKAFKPILEKLYFANGSPYHFGVLPVEILGTVYERFLGKVIRLTEGHQAKVEEKPEVRKAGGVYYTPAYIVDYIVKQTVGEQIEGKSPAQLAGNKAQPPLRVLDMACGSGSFLLGAYQCLLDHCLRWYSDNKPETHKRAVYQEPRSGEWRLTIEERKRILTTHIFGVDIDRQAVEVSKLSLLLKALEGENDATLTMQFKLFHERALPNLSENIKCGNSLIGPDYFSGKLLPEPDEMKRVNAFDWNSAFAEANKVGGFDCIIGNPPYIRVSNVDAEIRPYLYDKYGINHRFDVYIVFVERALRLLRNTGQLGFILPNKFFTSDYGSSLRALLTTNRAIRRVVDFGDSQVFADATVYTCLLFLSREPNQTVQYIGANTTRDATSFRSSVVTEVPANRLSEAPWTFAGASVIAILDRFAQFPTLSDFCEIKHGLQTGFDSVFLLTAHGDRAQGKERLLVKSEAESEPFEIERNAVRKVVKGAVDLRRYFIDPHDRYVLFPYETNDGIAKLIQKEEFEGKHPRAWAYLIRHQKSLRSKKKPGDWYGFRRRNYDLVDGVPRILVPSIAQRASFVADSIGEYHFVGSGGGGGGGYGLSLRENPSVSINFLLGVLNSRLIDWMIKLSNSRFGHGYYSYNRQYIESLPIPPIDGNDLNARRQHDEISRLAEQMLQAQKKLGVTVSDQDKGYYQAVCSDLDQKIDKSVFALYGLTEEEIAIVVGESK